MARRKRVFKRTSPDMGWFLGAGVLINAHGDPAGNSFAQDVIMTFDDIDELSSAMTKDKSDWFIKRILVDVYGAIATRTDGATAGSRMVDYAICTANDLQMLEWDANPSEIHSPGFWDLTRRVIRTYNRPVYDPFEPMIDEGNGGRLAVISQSGTAPGDRRFDAGWDYWGPSYIHDDFTVSSAGLVPESSLYIAMSNAAVGPGYFPGDQVAAYWNARVLLQKRRGG